MTGHPRRRRLANLRLSALAMLVLACLMIGCTAVWAGPIDWLSNPIDQSRAHHIEIQTAWHARIMTVAWGILLPLGVVVARFFKVWPGQSWPLELDRREWWRGHLLLQGAGSVLALCGLTLVLVWGGRYELSDTYLHRVFGWLAMLGLIIQVAGGFIRGSAGGPGYPAPDGSWRGDHYDMTSRRKTFEYVHKSIGYLALMCGCLAIIQGLWAMNAPRWMWIVILAWWLILVAFVYIFQSTGRAVDTYQAIWGPDPSHPGNRIKPIGFGVNRREK